MGFDAEAHGSGVPGVVVVLAVVGVVVGDVVVVTVVVGSLVGQPVALQQHRRRVAGSNAEHVLTFAER